MTLNVLVLESEHGAADEARRELAEAGHVVLQCHEPGRAGVPVHRPRRRVGVPAARGVVDVALTVRSRVRSQPAPTEDGVRCALMEHVPLVVAGPSALEPFDGFETRVLDRTYDVVATCEEAASAELVEYERRAAEVIAQSVGGDPARARVHVVRRSVGVARGGRRTRRRPACAASSRDRSRRRRAPAVRPGRPDDRCRDGRRREQRRVVLIACRPRDQPPALCAVTGTRQTSRVPAAPLPAATIVHAPPSRSARSHMFRKPLPDPWLSVDAHAVVGTTQQHDSSRAHGPRPRRDPIASACLATLLRASRSVAMSCSCIVVARRAVDRPVERHGRLEAERRGPLRARS